MPLGAEVSRVTDGLHLMRVHLIYTATHFGLRTH
jgi:hypothetical protein